MRNIFCSFFKNIFLVIVIFGISFAIVVQSIISSSTEIPKRTSLSYFNIPQTFAQQSTFNNKEHTIAQASGHFANNQIKDGIVTWIQGGLWNLQIKSLPNGNTSNHNKSNTESEKPNNMTAAVFNANFTMIKPDGSLSHSHLINNFSSNNVIFAGNDIIVTGIADIHSNVGLEYKQVPITVHLMGKKVLGLMINVSKTSGHFASSNEMFGTLISGIGLNGPAVNNTTTNASNSKVAVLSNNSAIK